MSYNHWGNAPQDAGNSQHLLYYGQQQYAVVQQQGQGHRQQHHLQQAYAGAVQQQHHYHGQQQPQRHAQSAAQQAPPWWNKLQVPANAAAMPGRMRATNPYVSTQGSPASRYNPYATVYAPAAAAHQPSPAAAVVSPANRYNPYAPTTAASQPPLVAAAVPPIQHFQAQPQGQASHAKRRQAETELLQGLRQVREARAQVEPPQEQLAKRQRVDAAVPGGTAYAHGAPRLGAGAAAALTAAQAAAAAAVRAAAVAPVIPPPAPIPAAPVLAPHTEHFYADLAAEVTAFAAAVAPTKEEVRVRAATFRALQAVVARSLPSYNGVVRAQLFGSEASGMATFESDLDVVVTGLAAPVNGMFDRQVKTQVLQMLRRLERDMRNDRALDIYRCFVISGARMPIIKTQLSNGLHLDVSISCDGGPKAAEHTQRMMEELPALRPLVLLLKSMLKQLELTDVSKGGLGGWSLINMVIAHLKEEQRLGHDASQVGLMLHSFLTRYGFHFDYTTMAIAPKRPSCFQHKYNLAMSEPGLKLCIEDPLTGRNVSGGTHRVAWVRDAFQTAARALSDAMKQHKAKAGKAGSKASGSRGNGSNGSNGSSGSRGKSSRSSTPEEGEARTTPKLPAPQLDGARSVSGSSKQPAASLAGSEEGGGSAQEWPLLSLVLDAAYAVDRSGGYEDDGGDDDNEYGEYGGGWGKEPQAGKKRQRE